ncbi:MAG: Smr/MutS family protein, partial [candidate division WOR-3 bacterium]
QNILKTLRTLRAVKQYFMKNQNKYPKLIQLIKPIISAEELEKSIDNKIDEFGEVKNNASAKLSNIRQQITKQRNLIIAKLQTLIQAKTEYLQDNTFVIRNNRYCLPLKVEAQNKLTGILHEYSPARKTIFIEPLELVNDQNYFAFLLDEEKNEIAQILAKLSQSILQIKDELLRSLKIIGELDVLLAKSKFITSFDCFRPKIASDRKFRIINGIHPLLKQKKSELVPLNIHFPDNTNIILISGPNAGGKTVALKTVGLIVLMALSGIYIPAHPDSEIPFFETIFVDITDEQSIDTNLSSFSAHLLQLKTILEHANEKSLILLDEIGSSTAPEEGSALAIAILETIRDKQSYCIATSHFNPLKIYVHDAKGMINAMMEYQDRPTYRLIMGFFGSSSALEISQKLGLPEKIINRAKQFLNQDWLNLAERMALLSSEIEKNQILQKQLQKEYTELKQLHIEYEDKIKNLKNVIKEERSKLVKDKQNFLLEQRRNIENLIRNIKESNASKQATVTSKTYFTEQLNEIKENIINTDSKNDYQNISYQVGNWVFSKTFQKYGEVVEIKPDQIKVAFGGIKVSLPVDDLQLATNLEKSINRNRDFDINIPNKFFQPLLNIRGLNIDEAKIAIENFLNQAYDFNVNEVRIIHGKGKGILKDMLWQLLKNDNRIEQFRLGESYEGGAGITKIKLKSIKYD